MYQKGLIKSSNIGTLAKLVTLYSGETYPDIEKKLVKRQRKVSKKRGLLKRLLINGRDDDFFNFQPIIIFSSNDLFVCYW